MTVLLAPADDRPLLRRVAARLDVILGYPRTLREDEITRHGRHAQRAPAPQTDSAFAFLVHDDSGASVLHGACALMVRDEAMSALRERAIEHDGARRRLREWITARGWQVRAGLPGQRSAWTRVAARDGAEGSATGTPIPEGEE